MLLLFGNTSRAFGRMHIQIFPSTLYVVSLRIIGWCAERLLGSVSRLHSQGRVQDSGERLDPEQPVEVATTARTVLQLRSAQGRTGAARVDEASNLHHCTQ